MANTLESYHHKISIKFDCLDGIIALVNPPKSIIVVLERLRTLYNDGISGILAAYYAIGSTGIDSPEVKAQLEKYEKFVIASSVVESLDDLHAEIVKYEKTKTTDKPVKTAKTPKPKVGVLKYNDHIESLIDPAVSDLSALSKELQDLVSTPDLDTLNTLSGASSGPGSISIASLTKRFNEQTISLKVQKLRINICECGSTMTLRSSTSELMCDSPECGQIVTLQGIVFEDSQIYTQQVTSSKSKKYDPNDHLSKWISKILAKEDYVPPPEIIDKINAMAVSEYTRRGVLRQMSAMRCEKVREWLQKCGFTECYDHAPMIRKIITGKHGTPVVPPEFTPEEQHAILIESSFALREFEFVITDPTILSRLGKDKIRNKFYYPYILWQIINLQIKDDRKRKILECIHLQSDDTLRRNDIVWKQICNRRGYKYYSAINH